MRAVLRHPVPVWSSAFSPDGMRVVTAASDDNTARIWDVSRYTLSYLQHLDPGRDFTCAERREYLHEDCTEPVTSP